MPFELHRQQAHLRHLSSTSDPQPNTTKEAPWEYGFPAPKILGRLRTGGSLERRS